MKKMLVILNYQREIPPYLQNLIHFANDAFERIIYITPELYNDNRETCRADRLQIVECPRSQWRRSVLKGPWLCLNKSARSQVVLARHNNMKISHVYKQIIRTSVCGDVLFKGFFNMVRSGAIDPLDTVILASWFSSEAYAAAMIKYTYPAIRAFSFAHAFDIDRIRNPYVMYDMNQIKHRIDHLIFISERMRNTYHDECVRLYPEISDKSWRTHYLGSVKRFYDSVSIASSDDVFRLVSCSSAVEVKRISLIINALTQWNGDTKVHWTHIGGGPLLEALKLQAKESLEDKDNVTYTFTGPYTNDQVQHFYVEHPVDLFVNVSMNEGLPVSLMECMSYGIPVLATDVGGSGEIVTEHTGFLLPKNFDSSAFLKALRKYMGLDEAQKESMRRECIAQWEDKFNAQINSKRLFDWLKSD